MLAKNQAPCNFHCEKSVRIRSFSGPYFSAFGENTEKYGVLSQQPKMLYRDFSEKFSLIFKSLIIFLDSKNKNYFGRKMQFLS